MNEISPIHVSLEEKTTFQQGFGAHLKALRKAKGLSQEEVAAQINMSVDLVSSLERGKIFTTSETILKFAKLHNVPVYELLIFPQDKRSANLALTLTKLINAQPPEMLQIIHEQIRLTLKQHRRG